MHHPEIPVGARMSADVRAQAAALAAAWSAALDATRTNVDDDPAIDEAEQVAYDAVVDFIEEHDLNYSEFDPRNGGEPDVARALREAARLGLDQP